MSYNQRIISTPVDLFWEGWRSDTITLLRHGWDFSADQDLHSMRYRLAMRNDRLGLTGISSYYPFDTYFGDMRKSILLQACLYPEHLRIQRISPIKAGDFSAVDVRPELIETHSLRDLIPFKEINIDAKQLFLEEASISDILEIALSKQSGKQREIRQRMLREESSKGDIIPMPESEIKAELRLVA